MRYLFRWISAAATALLAACALAPMTPTYPMARTVDQVDDYNGVKVADPLPLA